MCFSVIVFIKKLLAKGPQIAQHFESQIMRYVIYFLILLYNHNSHTKGFTMQLMSCSAMGNFLASSPEEVLFILLNFFKGSQKQIILHSTDANHLDSVDKVCKFFESKFYFWIEFLDKAVSISDQCSNQICEKEAAILWGSICCYPYINGVHQDGMSLLKKLICYLDRLLKVGEGELLENFFSFLQYIRTIAGLSNSHIFN
jgi:U3 small nucleolar RNA-associated protein 20